MPFIEDRDRERELDIKDFRDTMARGRLMKEQCDYIRKIKDNSTNENVIEFIETIEPYFFAVRDPDFISLLRRLDMVNLDKGKKVNANILKNNRFVNCYSFSTVDAYTISFKYWKLNIHINRRSSTVTTVTLP